MNQLSQLSLFSQLGRVEPTASEPQPSPEFRVRRSRRSKRMSIQVHPSGRVEVLAPTRSSDRAIQRFVSTNQAWIDSTRRAFRQRFGEKSLALPSAISLPALDRYCTVRYVAAPVESIRVRGTSQLVVQGPISDVEACRAALKRWLSRLAKREFSARLAEISKCAGLSYTQLQVRLQRTCWGSRSSSGTISLNYSLAFLSREQLDYILVHELCHSRYMNHSRKFWALVAEHCPDYRALDRSMDKAWADLPGWLDTF